MEGYDRGVHGPVAWAVCVVRLIGSLLGRLAVTDTKKDNPRVVSLHKDVCRLFAILDGSGVSRCLSYESSA